MLRELGLFEGCSPDQLGALASFLSITEHAAGDTLCRQATIGREFFVVVEGEAVVTIDGIEVGTMGPGCGFAEVALVAPEGRRTATVTAATPMTLLVLDRVEFAELLDTAPVVARRVLQDSASDLARTGRSRRIVASP